MKEDVWVGMLMNMRVHRKVYEYQVDFGAVIRHDSGLFLCVCVCVCGGGGQWRNTPFPTLPVMHPSVFSGPKTNHSND